MVSFWQGALVTALVAVTYQYQQGDLSFEATLRQLERRHPVSSSYGGYQTQYPAKYDYYRNVYPNEDSWDDDDEYRSRPMCVNMPRPNTFVSLGESSFLEMELEPLYPGRSWRAVLVNLCSRTLTMLRYTTLDTLLIHLYSYTRLAHWTDCEWTQVGIPSQDQMSLGRVLLLDAYIVYPNSRVRYSPSFYPQFSPEGCGQIGTVTVDYVMFPVPILDVTMKLDDPDFGIFQYNAYIGKTYSRTCDSKKFENPLSLSRTTQYFHESPRNIITARYSGDGRTVCGYWSSLHSRWNQNITVRPVLKSDPPAGAFIYSRSCFRGTRLDITSDRVIPDWFIVKSLRVTPGFNVTLFVNSDFSGYRQTFAEDVSSFTGTAFARYVGSVRMPLKYAFDGLVCGIFLKMTASPPGTRSFLFYKDVIVRSRVCGHHYRRQRHRYLP